jgi:hypothetical protein
VLEHKSLRDVQICFLYSLRLNKSNNLLSDIEINPIHTIICCQTLSIIKWRLTCWKKNEDPVEGVKVVTKKYIYIYIKSTIFYSFTFSFVQVHALYKECGDRSASCNCAVMVRSQDDVVVIDRCSDKANDQPPVDVRLYVNGELTPGTKIFRYLDGKKFRVSHETYLFFISLFSFFLYLYLKFCLFCVFVLFTNT